MTVGLNLGDLHQTRCESQDITARFTLPDKHLSDAVMPRRSVNEECMPRLWGNLGTEVVSLHTYTCNSKCVSGVQVV